VATIREDRTPCSAALQGRDTQPQFWAGVAGDVGGTVEGTRTLAGRYRDKHDFITVRFGQLDGVPRSSALAPLSVTLIGRPGDAVTAAITTVVVMVMAELSWHDAWQQPILRLAGTAIGVAVGVAAA